ncbi:MAG TPA: hypothetical protein VFH29_06715 [Anaerolineales bacterium]|nr:hypothetical protein [Anaerolineales bacterium]
MPLIALILAILSGLTVLAGYFVPALQDVQQLFLNWAIILAGTAAIVGIFNLVLVHAGRIQRKEQGAAYSAILLIALFATFVFGLVLGPDHAVLRSLVNAVIVPAESSLMGVLAITLIVGAVRLLGRRLTLMSIVFLSTAVLMLLGSATLPFGEIGALTNFARPWFLHVFAMGGARGIIVGMALGTMVTGLRVLIGAHRPYEGG